MHSPEVSSDSGSREQEIIRQEEKDREYKAAWEKAPAGFRRKAEELGLAPEAARAGAAMEFHEDWASTSYQPDMAETLDTHVDRLVEKHGHEELIRAIVGDLQAVMEAEFEANKAAAVARVACYLIKTETGSLQIRVHGMLHAIPRLALINGFPSLRESARACGCSPMAMKNSRDKWCHALSLPVPKEGTKSDQAKEAYRQTALNDHWRDRKFSDSTQTQSTPCKPIPPPNPILKNPPQSRLQLA